MIALTANLDRLSRDSANSDFADNVERFSRDSAINQMSIDLIVINSRLKNSAIFPPAPPGIPDRIGWELYTTNLVVYPGADWRIEGKADRR